MTYCNQLFRLVAGSSAKGGPLCPLNDDGDDDCGKCKGKVTKLTLQYNGSDADVEMSDDFQKGIIPEEL